MSDKEGKGKIKIPKTARIIIAIIVVVITALLVIPDLLQMILERSSDYALYHDIHEVNDGLLEYEGDCTLAQGRELLSLLKDKINQYSNEPEKRVSDVYVYYSMEGSTVGAKYIIYNDIGSYCARLEDVNSDLDESSKIHVVYQYSDVGYINKCIIKVYYNKLLNIAAFNFDQAFKEDPEDYAFPNWIPPILDEPITDYESSYNTVYANTRAPEPPEPTLPLPAGGRQAYESSYNTVFANTRAPEPPEPTLPRPVGNVVTYESSYNTVFANTRAPEPPEPSLPRPVTKHNNTTNTNVVNTP